MIIEIMVEQEGSDHGDELLTGFRHHVARGTPPGDAASHLHGRGFSVAGLANQGAALQARSMM